MEKAQDPLKIISSLDTDKSKVPLRSTHSVVAIVDVGTKGKSLLLPIELTAETVAGKRVIDANILSSAYKRDVQSLISEAIARENTGEVGVFYAKKEAANLLAERVQFPDKLRVKSTSNAIIRNFSKKVNMNFGDETQSRQFKEFFGDWQNDPAGSSKAVDEEGNPKRQCSGN